MCRVEIEWLVDPDVLTLFSYAVTVAPIPADYTGDEVIEELGPMLDSEVIFQILLDGEGEVDIDRKDSSFAQHASIVLPAADEAQLLAGGTHAVKLYVNLPRATADTRFVFALGVSPRSAYSNFYRLTDDCPKGH